MSKGLIVKVPAAHGLTVEAFAERRAEPLYHLVCSGHDLPAHTHALLLGKQPAVVTLKLKVGKRWRLVRGRVAYGFKGAQLYYDGGFDRLAREVE